MNTSETLSSKAVYYARVKRGAQWLDSQSDKWFSHGLSGKISQYDITGLKVCIEEHCNIDFTGIDLIEYGFAPSAQRSQQEDLSLYYTWLQIIGLREIETAAAYEKEHSSSSYVYRMKLAEIRKNPELREYLKQGE
jgi:hypothetical protein